MMLFDFRQEAIKSGDVMPIPIANMKRQEFSGALESASVLERIRLILESDSKRQAGDLPDESTMVICTYDLIMQLQHIENVEYHGNGMYRWNGVWFKADSCCSRGTYYVVDLRKIPEFYHLLENPVMQPIEEFYANKNKQLE